MDGRHISAFLPVAQAEQSPRSCASSESSSGSDIEFAKAGSRGWWHGILVTCSVLALGLLAVGRFPHYSEGSPSTGFLARTGEGDKNLPVLDFTGLQMLLDASSESERAERLHKGETKTLYHQTTPDACASIMAHGFRLGKPGIAGAAMYFAEEALHTGWKAQHWGCMIEAQVELGSTKRLQFDGDRSLTGKKLLQQGYDSVWIPRGIPHGSMPEWVVYFPDQIVGMKTYPCQKSGRPIGSHSGHHQHDLSPLESVSENPVMASDSLDSQVAEVTEAIPEPFTLKAFDGAAVLFDVSNHSARADRLKNGITKTVYHQTTPQACASIMANGFRMGRGGIAGGGMYFAEEARHTGWKAQHWGCMIESEVRMGNTKKLQFEGDKTITGEKLLRQGYDSVWIPRGIPHGSMPEWVVYFPDQIVSMKTYPCTKNGLPIGSHHDHGHHYHDLEQTLA